MNIHSFVDSIRGWVPEDPKMPKNRHKRFHMSMVTFLATTGAISMIFSFFMYLQPILAIAPPLSVQAEPNSSYIELMGILEQNHTFGMILTNGTYTSSDNLKLTFLVTQKSPDKCNVQFTFDCDHFCESISVEGNIIDGSLVIDSRPSVFLINSNVTKNRVVTLTEKGNWTLNAYLREETSHPSTAAEPYGVTALMAFSDKSHSTGSYMRWMLGYEPNTGILLYSGYSISDVLLEKVGVDLLTGGSLELASYSDNLNLEFYNWELLWMRLNIVVFCTYVGMALLVVAPTVFAAFKIRKKLQKRRHMSAVADSKSFVNNT
jgi:hypothetical protein